MQMLVAHWNYISTITDWCHMLLVKPGTGHGGWGGHEVNVKVILLLSPCGCWDKIRKVGWGSQWYSVVLLHLHHMLV